MSVMKRVEPFALLSFLLPLTVYLLTLAPSVTFFDSGEFITAISCLGSSHSPGYPLFINYAKPFTWLPFASVAYRVNFATAVSGSLACYGAYLLTTYILRKEEPTRSPVMNSLLRKGVGLAAAFTFAFSPRLWLQSNHDKPYPLVAFIVAIIFYLIFRWRDSFQEGAERPSYIFLATFLCGLASGAHQTIILMIPAFAYLILSTSWKIIFRIRDFIIAFIFALLGFAIHLHLPVRATRFPLLNWGDPQTSEQFLWHFLRKGYPSEKIERSWGLVWSQMNAFNIPYEFTRAGLLIMVVGMGFFFFKKRDIVISYLIALACFLLVIVGHFNAPLELIFLTEEFFTPLYLYSAVFVGMGLFYLLGKLVSGFSPARAGAISTRAAMVILLLSLPVTVCSLNYIKNDQHNNYVAYDYASNVLRSAPQGGILYTWGDSGAFPLWYIQGIEKMREDLDILHTPHLVFDWYLDGFPHLFKNSLLRRISLESQSPENVLLLALNEQYPSRPVLIDYSTRYSVPFNAYKFIQRGVTYQLLVSASKTGTAPDMSVWDLYSTRGLIGKEMFFKDLDTGKAIQIYANSRLEIGEAFLKEGQLGIGVENLKIAAQIVPELSGEIYQMLSRFGVR